MEFLNPNEVLNKLNLKANMTAADFGSGSGGWAIPLARISDQGKVYAIDILEEPLSALKSKAKLERISNIATIRSNVEEKEGSRLSTESCDLVLMTNLLFQCQDKKSVLEEGKRVLKKGGRILVVDWLPQAILGPKEGRVSPAEVKKIAKGIFLELKREFAASSHHFGLIFEK